MPKTPYLLQTGMGVDLHGGDDTTAACRAVKHAIGHNSLLFLREVGLHSAAEVHVDVTIACPHPAQIDTDAVAATLPVGVVSVQAEQGGMLADTGTEGDEALVAIAAVRVSVAQS